MINEESTTLHNILAAGSEWAIDYTKNLRIPMAILTTLINGIFAFIIFGGLAFAKGGVTGELILNILFYIIITPVLTVTMTKIMFHLKSSLGRRLLL